MGEPSVGQDGPMAPLSHTPVIDTVIFDLGGVLTANGRLDDFTKRFTEHDPRLVSTLLMGDYAADTDHPWHRLERGEITWEENRRLNRQALADAGIELPPPPPGGTTFAPNVPVVDLVHELKEAGFTLGVLTNNVREFRSRWWGLLDFAGLFHDVVDSHEVGLRKPNPAIYRLALERLGAVADRAAFLDDVQSNVDAATRVGMHGIVVDIDPSIAVAEVRRLAGLPSRGGL